MSVAVIDAPPHEELRRADVFCRRLARQHAENFTVASMILPGDLRVHLARIYAYCRVTDDLGDESRSVARLLAWREQVEATLCDDLAATHPVLVALRETVITCAIDPQLFLDLIAANLQDQRVRRYQSWADLAQYCQLSAAPVGRMVLAVLGIHGRRAAELSDSVCVGLQLANFAQDVSVDARMGRCYLPQEDVAGLGITAAVQLMCVRARAMLDAGRELEEMTTGRLRAQLAMYRLGGSAILDAVDRVGFHTDTVRPQLTAAVKARLAAEAITLAAADRQRDSSSAGIVGAQRACHRLARRNAGNFYWGFVALPAAQRAAIYSLYDFARQVDDAVDLPGEGDPRDRLRAHRRRLREACQGRPDDEVTTVLARAVARHRIPLAELDALVDGVERDLVSQRYATWANLSEYCRLVASTVGRMCVRIFGYDDEVALERADDLGLAMQLTNVLRDVRGDLEMGRVYLPLEELEAFDIGEAQLADEDTPPGWPAFVRFQARRAHELFASGLRVQRHIPRRAGICVLTMAGLYQRILEEIEEQPELPLRGRLSLSPRAKAAVLLRSAVSNTQRHSSVRARALMVAR